MKEKAYYIVSKARQILGERFLPISAGIMYWLCYF